MINFFVSGQRIRYYTPVIAADTLNYLTAHFSFTDSEWDEYTKWAHFRNGDTVYDIELNEDDEIDENDSLNLTVGEWEVYLTGSSGDARLTTVPVVITVKESGLIDAPLHVIPQSAAEQIDSKASQALLLAQSVKDRADAGEFDGTDGHSFSLIGYYDSLEELEAEVSEPAVGDAYGIGETAPYDIYVWDSVNGTWVNNGAIQGIQGETGPMGVTFTPSVDANGNLSWTNDGGLDNPETRNITGPTGATGDTGAAGASAYDKAVEAGYTGTEATFYSALTAMPFHNARHLPNGADPITIKTGNVEDAAITRAKLAKDSLFSPVKTISANYTLLPEDIGKTLMIYNVPSGTTSITITVPDTTTDQGMPTGAEFAVFLNQRGITVNFTRASSSVYIGCSEWGTFSTSQNLKLSNRMSMVALKKMFTNPYWYVSGEYETE